MGFLDIPFLFPDFDESHPRDPSVTTSRKLACELPEIDLESDDLRVLDTSEKRRVQEAFRMIISTYDSEITRATFSTAPICINQFPEIDEIHLHRRMSMTPPDLVLFRVYVDHSAIDQPVTTVADHVTNICHTPDCERHPNQGIEGHEALGTFDGSWYDLERDLLNITATMVGLPKHIESWGEYVANDEVRFAAVNCSNQQINFTFGFRPPGHMFDIYKAANTELAEELGIPLEPSVDELLDD